MGSTWQSFHGSPNTSGVPPKGWNVGRVMFHGCSLGNPHPRGGGASVSHTPPEKAHPRGNSQATGLVRGKGGTQFRLQVQHSWSDYLATARL